MTPPIPRCSQCGDPVKHQEPDDWLNVWASYCPKCKRWSSHATSEESNRPE